MLIALHLFPQSLISYSFVYAYGVYTIVFGFGITWLLILYLYLFVHINKLMPHHFPEEIMRPSTRFPKSTLEDSLIETTRRD